jgi:hypothetical protein
MSTNASRLRQVENEVVFREANERVVEGLDSLDKMADTEGYTEIPDKEDLQLHFYCECSDENCRERIVMKLSEYDDLHNNRKLFIVMPEHEVKEIERIKDANDEYAVVEKRLEPSETAEKLQSTPTKTFKRWKLRLV